MITDCNLIRVRAAQDTILESVDSGIVDLPAIKTECRIAGHYSWYVHVGLMDLLEHGYLEASENSEMARITAPSPQVQVKAKRTGEG